LIVGPHDPTERFTWWLRRVHQGGRFVVPAPAAARVQFIDARDLADWLLLQAVNGSTGVYNLCGPDLPLTWGDWMARMVGALQPAARPCWVDEGALLDAGVAPWMGLPLWLPAAEAGLHRVVIERALARGLRTRPLEDTARETLAWALAQPAPPPGGPGWTRRWKRRCWRPAALPRRRPVRAEGGSRRSFRASSHAAVGVRVACLQCTHRNTAHAARSPP
jgi:2'-hydroxyisoflavone reductase